MLRLLVIGLLVIFLAGCDPVAAPNAPVTGTPQSLETVPMTLGGQPFTIEVANEPAERATGLMHRTSMPADHGMIFAWPYERELSFYMKNTHIPLDILYVDRSGTIVDIQQMRPFDLGSYPSAKPAQFAIELNTGTARRVGLKVGDRIEIPQAVRDGARPD